MTSLGRPAAFVVTAARRVSFGGAHGFGRAQARGLDRFAAIEQLIRAFDLATVFLCDCVDPQGTLPWDRDETTSATCNIWTYAIAHNVLQRVDGARNGEAARRLLDALLPRRTASGLLPTRDRGEAITECAFMQAGMPLFLLPLPGLV